MNENAFFVSKNTNLVIKFKCFKFCSLLFLKLDLAWGLYNTYRYRFGFWKQNINDRYMFRFLRQKINEDILYVVRDTIFYIVTDIISIIIYNRLLRPQNDKLCYLIWFHQLFQLHQRLSN